VAAPLARAAARLRQRADRRARADAAGHRPLFGRAEERSAHRLGAAYDFLWSYLRWPLAFGALVLWATTMDHLMPNRRTRWRYDLPGRACSPRCSGWPRRTA
jgi:hypothetical protein